MLVDDIVFYVLFRTACRKQIGKEALMLLDVDYSKILTSRSDPDSIYYSIFFKTKWWEERKKVAKGQKLNQRVVDGLLLLEKYENGEVRILPKDGKKDLETRVEEIEAAVDTLTEKVGLVSDKIDKLLIASDGKKK